jgi:hypothetical protein
VTFVSTDTTRGQAWRPDPDSDAAHAELLVWLSEICSAFLPPDVQLSNWLKGNVGEAIAHCVGTKVAAPHIRVACANALDPFSGISRADIDIVWLSLDPDDPDLDKAILQEVKTTTDEDMSVVGALIPDYEKLFGTDVRRTLSSRLHAIASELRFLGGDDESAERVLRLAQARDPVHATKIFLRPTVVHEERLDPATPLTAVRQTLISSGWSGERIEDWTVALEELDERIVRLAEGRE